MKYFKLKFLLLFFALAAALPPAWAGTETDVLNQEFTGVTGSSYISWNNKTGTSGAVYAGNSAASYNSIQLRSTRGSAIVTTKSGGKVKSITVTWNENTPDGKTLNIYCSNTAYTLAGFATDFNNDNLTPVGTIINGTSSTLSIDNDYSYIAFTSASGALYLDKIEIVWETEGGDTPQLENVSLSFPQDSYTATLGQTFNAPTLSVDPAGAAAEVAYSSSDTDVATVDESTGAITLVAAGTTTITAAISGSETYQNATASYTLTVEKAPEPSEPMTYVKVTSTDDVTSGNYLIVYEGGNVAFDGSRTSLDAVSNTQEVAILDNSITTDKAIYFTYDATAQTLKSASGYYIGQTKYDNGLATNQTEQYINSIAIDDNGDAVIAAQVEGNQPTLRYNSASNQNRFRYYKSGQQAIQLYKEVNGDEPVVETVATPTFSVEEGTYTEAQNVTITCATEDAVIHYTVDGTDPTAESPVYAEAIAVGETMTIKAIAMKEGMTNSEIATATYTINIPSGDGQIYVKVTDPSQFVAGKKYIVVNEAKSIAMGAYSNDYCAAVNVTIVNGTINISNTAVVPLKLEEASTKYIYYNGSNKTVTTYSAQMQDGSNLYLGYGGSGTKLKTNARATDNYFWYFGPDLTSDKGNNLFLAEADTRSLAQGTSSTGTLRFGAYTEDNSVLYVEKSDEPVVTELTVALDPAEKTYTVGDVAKIMVNVENGNEDTMVSYKINGGEDQDYNAETGIVLPNDKAKEYTIEVYATDGDREATATGTYSFTAAPAFDITMTPNKEGNYTVGDEAVVNVTVDNVIGEDYIVTYTIGNSEEQIEYNAETGIVLPNDKAGDVTVKVYVTDGYDHVGEGTATATYHFDAAPAIVVTLDPASGNYYLGEEVKVTVTAQNTIGDYEVTYKIGDGEELDYEDGITITSDQEGTVNLTVTVVDGYHDGAATATGAYTFAPRPVATMPVFSLVGGTYGEAQQLTITAEDGATILYSTDGSEPTTEYTNAIDLGEGTTTVKAIAMKDGYTMSPEVSATYIIEIPEELLTITPFKGYYQIKNNGNGMYANIAGRKTLNFTDAPADKAGTVIWLETNDKGQVQSIRSQAADLQGYANRAMRYVPKMVEIVVNKINAMEGIEDATGAGSVLGETGLDSIMAKFNECFDYHLYVEQAGEGWRLYGKTPNMQHVVDFYRDHKSQVEAKLPKLEQFINDALDKLVNKIGGSSVFTDFSLHQIWEKMGGTLTEPTDDASTMAFYREVLNNKNYVWDFAYQTAQIYWGNVKNHPRYNELKAQLGEYADYIDEFVTQVRPDFKYYVIQRGNEPDYISEGNREIINNDPRTIWTLEPRTDFTVNIAGEQFGCPYADGLGGYATTNYTDFAYTVPEGVTAYKVTGVENGVAELEALSGVIPAQTPVLLIAKEAGDYVLTLSTEAGTAVSGNLLVGPDYLIKTYELKTPMVEQLFVLAKSVLGEQLYNQYVAEYEYLQLLYAGTVNNKYFWGLSQDNVKKCVYTNEENTQDCVIRNLGNGEFVNDWKSPKTNKAFLVSETDQTITINTLKGDVNHDGKVDIKDVTDLIDRLLGIENHTCAYCSDVNSDSKINIKDVTDLIDFLLNSGADTTVPSEGEGD